MQKLIQDISFGENLQKIRKSRGLSQYDVVRELQLRGRDMTRANYAHIEQGIRNIFISDLVLLRDIFGVSYEAFFQGLSFDSATSD
ncbi:MAG: helix-turn-helix transcriptional regulator [Oscillibacter sp.]|nr:helix-turn-helix transcriptional regulator [Oscillibacter sp.]